MLMLKIIINVENSWIESSKEQHLFKIEIFCNTMNVITVTFDQLNVTLLNKSNNLFKKLILLTPNFLNRGMIFLGILLDHTSSLPG